jgi:hypothetical protein
MKAGNTEMIESDYKYDPRVVLLKTGIGLRGATDTMDQL